MSQMHVALAGGHLRPRLTRFAIPAHLSGMQISRDAEPAERPT
ncbi:MAG: hypothetical protein ACHQ02_10880 [Candidatus Limnocylindrales bacterium]|jgi:hypothetical protein